MVRIPEKKRSLLMEDLITPLLPNIKSPSHEIKEIAFLADFYEAGAELRAAL